jgi:hypothetical protein
MKPQKALFYAAMFTEVSGLLMVVGALFPATLEPLVALLFGEAVTAGAPAHLATGIAGAVLTGWAITIAVLARNLDALSPHAVGNAVAAGVIAWFVLDSIVSVATGAALNVLGNVLYLVILLVPAWGLRSPAAQRQIA